MRAERSTLSVPAASRKMIEKAPSIGADAVMLDLEDSVAAGEKERARSEVIRAFREIEWEDRSAGYRVNGTDTPYFYRDLVDVVEAVGNRIGFIVIPKVSRAADAQAADILLSALELARGFPVGGIGLEVQIESAEGLLRVEEIARSTPRLQALIFGPGDFAASMRMPGTAIGVRDRWDEEYGGHRFGFAMTAIVVAARASGLLAIDGPVADFRDAGAYRRSSVTARSLGFDGKWCIHPSQVPIANEVFAPAPEDVEWARRIHAAYDAAVEGGLGAVTVDGQMIDAASVKMAQSVLDLARRAGIDPGAPMKDRGDG